MTAAVHGMGRVGQGATAGSLAMASSLRGAIFSSVMWRARCTAHSSFCLSRVAPMRWVIACSLGKMPMGTFRLVVRAGPGRAHQHNLELVLEHFVGINFNA